MDIALIEVDRKCELNNFIHSATGEECGFRVPLTEQEICDMECWKVQGQIGYWFITLIDKYIYIVIWFQMCFENHSATDKCLA